MDDYQKILSRIFHLYEELVKTKDIDILRNQLDEAEFVIFYLFKSVVNRENRVVNSVIERKAPNRE